LVLSDGRLAEDGAAVPSGREDAVPSVLDQVRFVVRREVSDREIARLLDEGFHITSVQERSGGEVRIEAVKGDGSR
jgi:hypothetical protein